MDGQSRRPDGREIIIGLATFMIKNREILTENLSRVIKKSGLSFRSLLPRLVTEVDSDWPLS